MQVKFGTVQYFTIFYNILIVTDPCHTSARGMQFLLMPLLIGWEQQAQNPLQSLRRLRVVMHIHSDDTQLHALERQLRTLFPWYLSGLHRLLYVYAWIFYVHDNICLAFRS